MAAILVFAEQRNGTLKSYALEAVSEGRRLADASGGKLVACLLGSDIGGLTADLSAAGADEILVTDNPEFGTYLPGAYAATVAAAVEQTGAELILFSSSAMGRELAPLTGAKLNASVVSDITEAEWKGDHLEVIRPVYAGKAILRVAVKRMPAVVTLRPNVFPAEEKAGSGAVNDLAAVLDDSVKKVQVISTEVKESTRPELTEASIIVSGGRGMGGPENYPVIEALADTLGAAVGASRASVDAGWRPHSDQVGQTGKTVSPNLYIAVGISGAIQHLAGMSSSKVIVAINTDAEAPIFKVADYGIVGDLFEVVPVLDAKLKELLG